MLNIVVFMISCVSILVCIGVSNWVSNHGCVCWWIMVCATVYIVIVLVITNVRFGS